MWKKYGGKGVNVLNQKEELRSRILQEILPGEQISDDDLYARIDRCMDKHFANDFIRLEKRRKLRREIFNSIRKLDVIQELLDDDEVTEIMVNGPDEIFIEKEGRIFKSPLQFENQERLDNIAQQIASAGNRIVNETNPILDARLEDGSRVNIVVPPIAIEGPVITIRKFPKEIMTMEKLVQLGSITREAEVFLRKMVQAKYNIFISGGTGAGKTTFLNVLSGFIPRWERVVTIEDSAELQIQNIDNLVRLESRNANVEGKNQITIRDLVKSALRMRPDRIIVCTSSNAKNQCFYCISSSQPASSTSFKFSISCPNISVVSCIALVLLNVICGLPFVSIVIWSTSRNSSFLVFFG